jgi:putative two-component system response regulator
VLHKPGPLDRKEFDLVRQHPEVGAEILRPLRRFEGPGYPYGLKGSEVPLAARVVAVADAFDAMTSDRPYRAAVPVMEAFDPRRR